jgi:hypothetical protein
MITNIHTYFHINNYLRSKDIQVFQKFEFLKKNFFCFFLNISVKNRFYKKPKIRVDSARRGESNGI